MPWAAGSFSRFYGVTGWQSDLAGNIYILASRHDTHDQDLANGINACLTRDNQAKPTASFLPQSNNAYDLGSASFIWRRIYGLLYSDAIRYDITTAEIAASVTPTNYSYLPGYWERYGADNTGVNDSSAAAQAAANQWKQARGARPRAGAGTFRIDTVVAFTTTSSGVFTQGAVFEGAGGKQTFIDNRVATGNCFSVDTNTTLKFQIGVRFKGFTIMTTTSPAASNGLYLRRAYQVETDDVFITGLTGSGIRIIVNEGDGDGSVNVVLKNGRIDNCAGWGITSEMSAGLNEFSFLKLDNFIVSGCGTASATVPPPTGGIHWKGQVLYAVNSGCVINENIGLYIEGGSGLPNTVTLDNFVLENNKKRGIYCTGIDGLKARNLQLYNNDSYTSTNAVEFDASASSVRNVDIDGVIVRATSGNSAYTAFKISGTNAVLDTCRVRNVSWQNFDYAGQTRFNGFQFDAIQQQCEFNVLGGALARFRPSPIMSKGNTSPIRLRGGAGGTPSTSGEWVATQIATAGLSISNAALANSTNYHCYLYDVSGTATLELSTTVPVLDTTFGYYVKTGDATRLWIGGVRTDGAGAFLSTGGSNFLNAFQLHPDNAAGAGAYLWSDSSNKLRIKTTYPASDTDGTIVGTQT